MARVAPAVVVDRGSPVPLYFQVAEQLQRQIEQGGLPAGTMLENEIALAGQLGVSRPTMRRAIGFLVDRGLVVRKRGVGTQVITDKVRRPLQLTSLFEDLVAAGRKPTTRVLELSVHPATEAVAAALAIPDGADVIRVVRLRLANDEPIALMTNDLPLGHLDLDEVDLEETGLYQALRAAGTHIRVADQTIGAVNADAAQARLLGERRGAALLTMTRTAYDDQGRPVEHGTHLYRASRYAFSLTLVER